MSSCASRGAPAGRRHRRRGSKPTTGGLAVPNRSPALHAQPSARGVFPTGSRGVNRCGMARPMPFASLARSATGVGAEGRRSAGEAAAPARLQRKRRGSVPSCARWDKSNCTGLAHGGVGRARAVRGHRRVCVRRIQAPRVGRLISNSDTERPRASKASGTRQTCSATKGRRRAPRRSVVPLGR